MCLVCPRHAPSRSDSVMFGRSTKHPTRVLLTSQTGMALSSVALAVFVRTAQYVEAVCYGANISTFPWCSGYAKAGYNCSGDMCASAKAIGQDYFCAIRYVRRCPQTRNRVCECQFTDAGCCSRSIPPSRPARHNDLL